MPEETSWIIAWRRRLGFWDDVFAGQGDITYIGMSSHFFCPRNYKINFEGFSPKFLSRVSNYSPQHRRIDVLYN